MKELLEKRVEYLKKINIIETQIEIDVQNYKKELNNKFVQMIKDYRTSKVVEANEKIDMYKRRINVLDEMIKEDVPEVDTLTTLMGDAKDSIEETTVEETKEDVNEDEIPNVIISNEEITGDSQIINLNDQIDAVVENDNINISDEVTKGETSTQILERPGMPTIEIPSRI